MRGFIRAAVAGLDFVGAAATCGSNGGARSRVNCSIMPLESIQCKTTRMP